MGISSTVRRLAVIVAIFALVGIVFVRPVGAGVTWCKTDPVVMLDGVIVDISSAIPLEYVPLVNGPVVYEVQTPKETSRQLILNDLGYNGHGSIVKFTNGNGVVRDSNIPVRVTVHIPIDTSRLSPGEQVPVELTIIAEDLTLATTQGTSGGTTADAVVTKLVTGLLGN